eukprot:Sspe_Gene.29658::Locus_14215_Transcript_1_1_Confidence_1.000_Length_672::g.29658::m.29658
MTKEVGPKNSFMVSTGGVVRKYVHQALQMLEAGQSGAEGGFRTVDLFGRGRAMSLVVQIAEILKRRIKGLHQITEIESTKVVDTYAPKNKEKATETVDVEKTLSGLHITLSLDALDAKNHGYQEPIPDDQVGPEEKPKRKKKKKVEQAPARGRGAARGAAAPARGRGAATTGRGGGRHLRSEE